MLVSLPALLFQESLFRSCLSVYKIDDFGLPFLFVAFCLKYRMIALLAGVLESCLKIYQVKYIVRTISTSPILLQRDLWVDVIGYSILRTALSYR